MFKGGISITFAAMKFLVTDLVPPGCIATIEQLGFEVDHIEDLDNEELKKIIPRYTGLVVRTSLIMNKEMLDAATQMKYILRPGSGMDNIDVPYAESKGIKLFNSPEANSDAVAEHAIGLILGLLNFIPRSFEQVKNAFWVRKENTGKLLKGKTIAIIGYGNTGTALGKKLQGFEVNVLVYDKYKKGFASPGITEATLEDIFEKADILSLHIPLTDETFHLVNEGFIANFKKPFYLVNTSRGKIADTVSVIKGLRTGKLLGAALDVLENEKISSYSTSEKALLEELLNAGNVVITPHIAGWTTKSREDIFYVVLDKFKNYLLAQ
jgi:D-3-phosphoglycerate dehydrogenase / 2-oxoglutarate reductase